jgi:putative membrane protein
VKIWSALALSVALVLSLGILAAAQQSNMNQNMPTGKAFVKKAADINLDEIELGKLAEQKGNDAMVKDFGKRMVEDHTQAENQLKPIAQKEGVTLPTQAGENAAKMKQQLSGLSGTQFDQVYIKHMMSGHKDAIACFENEIEHGNTQAIKSYAASTLPVIQDHIRIAEDVAGKMGMAGGQGLESPNKAIAVK